jgi:succinyl-CoA synthetase alpha subunit
MSILISTESKVLAQGITGHQGRFETKLMLDYGTNVVAGVAPDPTSGPVHGVPLYPNVAAAVSECEINTSICYVPAVAVRDAVMEALAGGVKLVLIPAERVPVRDAAYLIAAAKDHGARLLGPNTQGVVAPGVGRLGGPGGTNPDRILAPGKVGVVSRSGGMAGEISWLMKRSGLGTSTQVHIGGEALLGITFAEVIAMFEADPQTEAIAMFGERGVPYEEQAAAFISAACTKPIVAFVAGRSLDELSSVSKFGHSGNIIRGSNGLVSEKVKALENAGVTVTTRLADMPEIIQERLASRPSVKDSQ